MIGGGRFAGSLAYLHFPDAQIQALLGYGGSLLVRPTNAGVLTTALQFWPVAIVAGLATWLIHLRHTRWSRMAVDHGWPNDALPGGLECEPPPPPDMFTPSPPARPPPAPPTEPRAQAQGADLAARARFVAMTFAFPDTAAGPPQRGIAGWPLHLDCRPTRFTLTLQQAALGYRLEFCNRGAAALGPLIIRADLVAAKHQLSPSDPLEFALDALPICHYLDGLPAGETLELAGELRLPLAGITALRLGAAELLIPLLRLCAESAGDSRPALGVSACFAIGTPPLSVGGGIQPFRLDAGPGIWRKLSVRRLLLAEFP